jgi:hypothetical protein
MNSTTSLTTTPAPSATDPIHASRAGRLFLASTLSFIGLVLTMGVGLSDRQSVQAAVAEDLGVGLDDVPAGRLADVIRDTWNTPAVLLIGALALLSAAVYSRGMVHLGRITADHRPELTRLATALPMLGVAAFILLLGLERALTDEPVWLVDNWWVAGALLTTFVLAVTFSLVAAVVRLWPTGLAPRSSIAVLLLSVVVAVLSITAGAPPVLPLVLATGFALGVRRATRRTSRSAVGSRV